MTSPATPHQAADLTGALNPANDNMAADPLTTAAGQASTCGGGEFRERPILFSGEMVRAILDERKTQTRRVLNPQPNQRPFQIHGEATGDWFTENRKFPKVGGLVSGRWRCPYGQPGDRLWVKETHQVVDHMQTTRVIYRADGLYQDESWRPSIFMRRMDSRITLEIASVRVERVQEITEEDAKAEGIEQVNVGWGDDVCYRIYGEKPVLTGKDRQHTKGVAVAFTDPVKSYQSLWDSLNASRGFGWAMNPWVWRIEFRRIDQGDCVNDYAPERDEAPTHDVSGRWDGGLHNRPGTEERP